MAGVQAGSAGRLSIEIVAEIARLQQDMDRVRRLVKDASGDIGRSAKAANDNLASVGKGASGGVQQYARDVAALKAQLDPAWAAQQRFNEAQQLGIRAFKAGAIDRQQLIEHMRRINEELKGGGESATRASAGFGTLTSASPRRVHRPPSASSPARPWKRRSRAVPASCARSPAVLPIAS